MGIKHQRSFNELITPFFTVAVGMCWFLGLTSRRLDVGTSFPPWPCLLLVEVKCIMGYVALLLPHKSPLMHR